MKNQLTEIGYTTSASGELSQQGTPLDDMISQVPPAQHLQGPGLEVAAGRAARPH